MKGKQVSVVFVVFLYLSLSGTAQPLWAEKQVTDVAVRHYKGQTFITWQEVGSPEVKGDMDGAGLKKALKDFYKDRKIRYRIYRSNKPITSIRQMAPIAEVGPSSCWNLDYYGGSAQKGKPAIRYVIKEGDGPLAPGTGLYVHNPRYPQKQVIKTGGISMVVYYAVTWSEDGRENKSITAENSTRRPVKEFEGQGVPVLQRIIKPKEFAYINKPELHYYVRWEAPPNASVQNKPIDYLVAIPPNKERTPTPVGLHLHCWGGSLNGGYGWWYHYTKLGTTYLISSNQIPYDWWTGYHELYYSSEKSAESWKEGVVKPYTTTRMLSFLDWAAKKYDLDLTRVFTAGSSMGGSGAPMFAIRYPNRIAWSIGWVGVHDPGNTPQFTGSYENVYGKKQWGIEYEDGTPAFEYYKDAAYLRRYPEKEIGFITWSNGKNDGGIGWPQALEFFRAMQETRRPHIFVWGLSGHGQRATMPAEGGQRVMPLDIRLDQSLPAFTNCSLDDNPGTATRLKTPKQVTVGRERKTDPYDGDPKGQINLYLYWDTRTIVDITKKWEIIIGLTKAAPKEDCTVDITPRRLQKFSSLRNKKFTWRNISEGNEIQSGRVTADSNGLITIEKVKVTKAKNRIILSY